MRIKLAFSADVSVASNLKEFLTDWNILYRKKQKTPRECSSDRHNRTDIKVGFTLSSPTRQPNQIRDET